MCIEARAAPVGMGVWATKAGMTSIFTPEGLCLPATVLALEEGNIVTQVHQMTRMDFSHASQASLDSIRTSAGWSLLSEY